MEGMIPNFLNKIRTRRRRQLSSIIRSTIVWNMAYHLKSNSNMGSWTTRSQPMSPGFICQLKVSLSAMFMRIPKTMKSLYSQIRTHKMWTEISFLQTTLGFSIPPCLTGFPSGLISLAVVLNMMTIRATCLGVTVPYLHVAHMNALIIGHLRSLVLAHTASFIVPQIRGGMKWSPSKSPKSIMGRRRATLICVGNCGRGVLRHGRWQC